MRGGRARERGWKRRGCCKRLRYGRNVRGGREGGWTPERPAAISWAGAPAALQTVITPRPRCELAGQAPFKNESGLLPGLEKFALAELQAGRYVVTRPRSRGAPPLQRMKRGAALGSLSYSRATAVQIKDSNAPSSLRWRPHARHHPSHWPRITAHGLHRPCGSFTPSRDEAQSVA